MFTIKMILLIRLIVTIGKVVHRTNALVLIRRLPSLLLGDSDVHVVKILFFVAYPRHKLFEGVFALPDIVVVNVELGQLGLHNRIHQYCNEIGVLQHESLLQGRQKDPLQSNNWSGILLHFDNLDIIHNLHVSRLQVLDKCVEPEGDIV